jgi:hypothetical protein
MTAFDDDDLKLAQVDFVPDPLSNGSSLGLQNFGAPVMLDSSQLCAIDLQLHHREWPNIYSRISYCRCATAFHASGRR